jgi:uncharacterized protein
VQAGGRVDKYRHYAYEWLGVDKTEVAVMTELLLRGAQSVGDLRGRAARMAPIADLAALRPILDRLKAKGLVIALTPEGRGQIVSHALYTPRELERLRETIASAGPAAGATRETIGSQDGDRPQASGELSASAIDELRAELAELRSQVTQLVERLDRLEGR